jgi:hypothetical protein
MKSTSEKSKYRLPRQGEPPGSFKDDYTDIKVEGRREKFRVRLGSSDSVALSLSTTLA